jgi:hypothetical protein
MLFVGARQGDSHATTRKEPANCGYPKQDTGNPTCLSDLFSIILSAT